MADSLRLQQCNRCSEDVPRGPRQILFGAPPKGGPVGERDVTLW